MSQLKLQDVLKELSIQAFDYIRNGDDDFEGFVHSLEFEYFFHLSFFYVRMGQPFELAPGDYVERYVYSA
mgnify:CR=1 FL=1